MSSAVQDSLVVAAGLFMLASALLVACAGAWTIFHTCKARPQAMRKQAIQRPQQIASGMVSNAGQDNLDSPYQRTIDILTRIKLSTRSIRMRKQLDYVITTILSADMYSPKLEQIDNDDLDDDVKDFLVDTVIGRRAPSFSKHREDSNIGTISRNRKVVLSAGVDAPNIVYMNAFEALEYLALSIFDIPKPLLVQIGSLLERVDAWDFDIFLFSEATNGHPLLFLTYYLIKKMNSIENIPVNEITLLQYLDEIEMTYQSMWCFLADKRLQGVYTRTETFASILACVVHDVDHPGVTNNFMVKSRHPLAILYNDMSVLEFHHASIAIEIAERRGLFEHFSPVQYDETRKQIIELVMATDMAKHFEFLGKFKSLLTAAQMNPDALTLDKAENKALVLSMAIKCSDLNNPTRARSISLSWTTRIMEEFHHQGDKEKEAGLPYSKFMNRESQGEDDAAKCQISFIDVIVQPLYQSWISYLKSPQKETALSNMQGNREYWYQRVHSRENLNSYSSTHSLPLRHGSIIVDDTQCSKQGSQLNSVNRSNRSVSFSAGQGGSVTHSQPDGYTLGYSRKESISDMIGISSMLRIHSDNTIKHMPNSRITPQQLQLGQAQSISSRSGRSLASRASGSHLHDVAIIEETQDDTEAEPACSSDGSVSAREAAHVGQLDSQRLHQNEKRRASVIGAHHEFRRASLTGVPRRGSVGLQGMKQASMVTVVRHHHALSDSVGSIQKEESMVHENVNHSLS